MANEISTLTDLNGVTHDIEDSTARSAIQTLDGQAVKSVNGQTPTAGAVLIEADDIGYDNTTSGMTADDLQEAVDELNTGLGTKANSADLASVATSGAASDVSYDNTNSGMTADDVQEAVDELNAALTGINTELGNAAQEATGQSILTTETAMNTTLNTLLTRLVDAHPTAEAGDLIVQDLVQGNVLLAQLAVNIEESGVF